MAEYFNVTVSKPIPTRMRNWGIYIKTLKEWEGRSKEYGISGPYS